MLLALIGAAWPCANIVTAEGDLATSDAQEVVLRSEAGEVTVDYRVEYDGDAEDFGWIIAVSGDLVGVDDGDEALFEGVREASQPTVMYEWAGDSGSSGPVCGCGGMAKGGDNLARGGDTGDLVEQIAEGFTGTYSWVAVTSEDSSDLQAWMDNQGFDLGESGPSIDAYVAEGATFVLVTVGEAGGDTPPEGRVLPPLSLRYEGEMSFPARMARYAQTDEMSTRIYVLGDQTATMSGWTYRDLEWLSAEGAPAVAWQEALREHGADQAYARVYAGDYEGRVLTRFETVAPVEVHTADPVLALDGRDARLHATISVWGEPGDSAAWLVLLPLAGLGWGLRRRD
jgi:hypothetical protein